MVKDFYAASGACLGCMRQRYAKQGSLDTVTYPSDKSRTPKS